MVPLYNSQKAVPFLSRAATEDIGDYANLVCVYNSHCMVMRDLETEFIAIFNLHKDPVCPLVTIDGSQVSKLSVWDILNKSINKHSTMYELIHLLNFHHLPILAERQTPNLLLTKLEIFKIRVLNTMEREPLPAPYIDPKKKRIPFFPIQQNPEVCLRKKSTPSQ